MKINKYKTYTANSDVLKIDLGVNHADIIIKSYQDTKLKIEYSKFMRVFVAEGDGVVTFRQTARSIFRKPQINLYVPECNVPDLRASAKSCSIFIDCGIYNDADLSSERLKAEIYGANFKNLTVKAEQIELTAENITVKNLAAAIAREGNIKIDGSYCKKAECRLKKGNIGICSSACDYATLNSGNGNINASMIGKQSDYRIEVQDNAVKQKSTISACDKAISARAVNGNVVLNFEKQSAQIEGEKEAKQNTDDNDDMARA